MSSEDKDFDLQIMRQALELARQSEGRTAPNPAVGAIVLDSSGAIIGRGFHPRAGEPHAEVFAFDEAGDRARGGTLYVTLEPCCHHGRTPPCLDLVLASGVRRVVIGMLDPNPIVAGKSLHILKERGIDTVVGVNEEACSHLNRGFVKKMTAGLPWVALKLAVTLDGRIADRSGSSRWISGPEARRFVHELRNKFDCVLVGPGTATKDDPELNVRDIEGSRDPVRAVFDPVLTLAPGARMCTPSTGHAGVSPRTIVLCEQSKATAHRNDFAENVQLVGLSDNLQEGGRLLEAMRRLGESGINTVLCEGGGKFAATMLEQKLVDEVYWIVAPKFLVDGSAVSGLSGKLPKSLAETVEIESPEVTVLGRDVLISGRVTYPSAT